MAAIELQRCRRKPGQDHLTRRHVDADGAAQDLACARQVELGVAPHRDVEALEARQLRQRARQPARDEPLHGDGELQALGALVLVGAEVEGPGPGKRVDLGAPGDRAAAALVVEIDVELGHAPDALAGAVVDDDGGGLEPDLAQEGAGILATARARRAFRQHLDEVDAAERSVRHGGRRRGRQRLGPGTRGHRFRALALVDLGGHRELERERTLLVVEQRQPRGDQSHAFRGQAPNQERLAAERHDRGGRQGQGCVAGIGDAHVPQLELQLVALAQPQRDVFDLHVQTSQLLGDGSLDRMNEEVERHRAVQQAHIEHGRGDDGREGWDAGHLGEEHNATAPPRLRPGLLGGGARDWACYGTRCGTRHRPAGRRRASPRPLPPGIGHAFPSLEW